MEAQYISYIVITLSIIACITVAISTIAPIIEEWHDMENQRKALSMLAEIDSSITSLHEKQLQTLQLNAPDRVSLAIKRAILTVKIQAQSETQISLNYSLLELTLESKSKSIEEGKPWFSSYSFVEVNSHTPLIIISRFGSMINVTYVPKVTICIWETEDEFLIEITVLSIMSSLEQTIFGGWITINLKILSTWNWSMNFDGNSLREIVFETSLGNFSLPLHQVTSQLVNLKITLYTVGMEVIQH